MLALKAPEYLESSRLILRRFKTSDIDIFSRINQDPNVMKFMAKKKLSKEDTSNWVERIWTSFKQNNYGLWALEIKKNKSL